MLGCYIPKRYILIGLAHFGFFVVYALRVNLSVALVAMVNSTYAHVHPSTDPECPNNNNNTTTTVQQGEFDWDQNEQALLLSSFFYGYLFTQIPGGYLGNRYGGKLVFGLGILVTSVLTLVTPLVAGLNNLYLLVALRVLEGLGEGVTFPVMHGMIAKWSPTNEKSRMVVFAYSGASSGTVVSLPICGILCSSTFLGGWPSAFYVFGVVGVVWFMLWMLLVSDSPHTHSTISYAEKKLIVDSQRGCVAETPAKVPWCRIFTSLRVWAIIVAHVGQNWVWYLVLTGLPSYFKQVLNFNLTQNGFLSALPFIAAFATTVGGGAIADFMIRRGFRIANVRRGMGIIGYYSAALCLVLSSYAGCDQIDLSVAYMVMGTGLLCMNNSGFNVNHLDLSPRFSGVLMGLTNFFGTISGCVTPLVTGYFTNNEPTRAQYRKVFLLAAGMSVVCGTFFNIFVSGEIQEWNDVQQDDHSTSTASKVHVYANDEIADRINSSDGPADTDYLLADDDESDSS